jgi:outer membrane protein assembly factor BamB
LGGREVNYVAALEALAAESRTWPDRRRGDDWPTFAGNAARNRVQPIEFDAGRVRWQVPLGTVAAGDHDYPARRTAEDRKTLLSYWPIVVDGHAFVADGGSVRGYQLATGEPAWGDKAVFYPSDGRPEQSDVEQTFSPRPTIGVPRYTLTAHDGRLYARLGRPVTSAVVDGGVRGPTSSIVCLDLKAEGKFLWALSPPEGDRWAFEGAPIADDDFIYVGLRKGGVRPQSHLACYDVETHTLQWKRLICSAETPGQGSYDEITHNLPTLVGDVIYYNTNLGAVAAVSKHDGEIRWIVTYPRSSGGDLNQRAVHFFRDLTPCVYDRGTLFVAPSDSRQIMALDASCGLLRWETSLADDVVHLLGTSGDYLSASGERQWWIHALSGRIAYVWPDESPKGFGRGALVGDAVLRPTRTTIEVLGMADGRRRREIELTTRGASGGNLVAVDDSLLITTGDELIVLDRHAGSSSASASAPAAASPRVPPNPRVDE